jgi:hypothetical protein
MIMDAARDTPRESVTRMFKPARFFGRGREAAKAGAAEMGDPKADTADPGATITAPLAALTTAMAVCADAAAEQRKSGKNTVRRAI